LLAGQRIEIGLAEARERIVLDCRSRREKPVQGKHSETAAAAALE